MEPTKLKKVKLDYSSFEFVKLDYGMAISKFAVNLQWLLKDVPKTRKYRINLEMYRFEKKEWLSMPPPVKLVEFSPYEFGTVIAIFGTAFPLIYKNAKRSRKFRINLKCFQVLRVREKKGGKNG